MKDLQEDETSLLGSIKNKFLSVFSKIEETEKSQKVGQEINNDDKLDMKGAKMDVEFVEEFLEKHMNDKHYNENKS